jgi:hypothetical protein
VDATLHTTHADREKFQGEPSIDAYNIDNGLPDPDPEWHVRLNDPLGPVVIMAKAEDE